MWLCDCRYTLYTKTSVKTQLVCLFVSSSVTLTQNVYIFQNVWNNFLNSYHFSSLSLFASPRPILFEIFSLPYFVWYSGFALFGFSCSLSYIRTWSIMFQVTCYCYIARFRFKRYFIYFNNLSSSQSQCSWFTFWASIVNGSGIIERYVSFIFFFLTSTSWIYFPHWANTDQIVLHKST